MSIQRANPSTENYEKARQLVMNWVRNAIPTSIAETLDGDLLGQLADDIAWALEP